MSDENQCQKIVYIRDTYRYDGRGKGGFSMHYKKRKCKRKATCGEFCSQHAAACGGGASRALKEK